MLVSTMNWQEIISEAEIDMKKFIPYHNDKNIDKAFRVMKKNGQSHSDRSFQEFKVVNVQTNNEYRHIVTTIKYGSSVISFFYKRITAYGKIHYIIGFQTGYGREDFSITIYSDHFFKRYNERMNCNKSIIQIIKEFFENNDSSEAIKNYYENKKYVNSYYVAKKDGLFLLQKEGKYYIAKTFISNNMINHKEEKEIFDKKELIKTMQNFHKDAGCLKNVEEKLKKLKNNSVYIKSIIEEHETFENYRIFREISKDKSLEKEISMRFPSIIELEKEIMKSIEDNWDKYKKEMNM